MPLDAEQIIKRYESSKGERGTWESHWQEVADLVLPSRQFTTSNQTPGGKRRTKIYDATAPRDCIKFASALHSLLTNPAIRWFDLTVPDEALNRERDVRIWLDDTTRRLLNLFNDPSSGFGTSSFEILLDLVAFGTGIQQVHKRDGSIRFTSRPISEMYLVSDDDGEVVASFRGYSAPASEVVSMFGNRDPGPSAKVRELAEDIKKSETQVEIIHYVFYRDDADPMRRDGKNKPVGSIYVEVGEKHIISESGFDEFPYLTPRWSRDSGETYGRSVSMSALSDIAMLNAMAKTTIEAAEKAVSPPLTVTANAIEGPVRTAPNSMIYVRHNMQGRAITPLELGDPRLGVDLLGMQRSLIHEHYYMDLINLPELDRMTATEVMERVRQKLQIMSPVLSRLYSEWLTPLISRAFRFLKDQGMLLDAPEGIQGRKLDVQYTSPLALSQRASESTSFLQLMNSATPLLTIDPAAMANIDSDVAIRTLAAQLNVNPLMLRTEREVKSMRQQQDEMLEAAQQAKIAKTGSEAARNAAAGLRDVRGG